MQSTHAQWSLKWTEHKHTRTLKRARPLIATAHKNQKCTRWLNAGAQSKDVTHEITHPKAMQCNAMWKSAASRNFPGSQAQLIAEFSSPSKAFSRISRILYIQLPKSQTLVNLEKFVKHRLTSHNNQIGKPMYEQWRMLKSKVTCGVLFVLCKCPASAVILSV